MKRVWPRTKKVQALAIVVVIGLLVVNGIVLPVAVEKLATGKLDHTFAAQQALLENDINQVVGAEPEHIVRQCVSDHWTYVQSTVTCQAFAAYTYNQGGNLTESNQAAFVRVATNLDALLRRNGWINDRPHDAVTTIVASNPYDPKNGGQGGEVPMHKNIGDISCNLEVDVNGFSANTAPGAVNVNLFSCRQQRSFFQLHLTRGRFYED